MNADRTAWNDKESGEPDEPEETESLEANIELETLLDYLKQSRAFDFTGYKRASLTRRINKRMQTVEVESYGEYQDYLEVHPDEFGQLFNTILINVTHFFRDPAAWDHLVREALPQIIARKPPPGVFRVWSAGCASGEEAYTIAMLLCEALGPEALRERVKIYATDIDMDALNRARLGSYADHDVAAIPPALLEKYFEQTDGRYVFRKDLRRSLIFGRHDLIQDSPISRIDLLMCRNVLMYFNGETQSRIMNRFHFALNDNGFLFLGRAEMLFTHSTLFLPVDLKHRLFSRLPNGRDRGSRFFVGGNSLSEETLDVAQVARARDASFEAGPTAQIVVDGNGVLALANERARQQFGLTSRNLGRPLQDFELSYRPADLRSAIDQANNERRVVLFQDVKWTPAVADTRWLDIQVTPLAENRNATLGVMITFTDVTRCHLLQEELEHATQSLVTAYEELQSTNEELETTNEELQSTVEELETTNEELQSTNEELETMNEELQSTNEELQTMNEEMRHRGLDLSYVNMQMESLLASLQVGVAVVDAELRVQLWSRRSEDLWGLRADEVGGHNLLNLDIGLPTSALRPAIRACLTGESRNRKVTLDAINRRGRAITCRVDITPLQSLDGQVKGVVLLMEESAPREESARDGSAGLNGAASAADRNGTAPGDGASGSSASREGAERDGSEERGSAFRSGIGENGE